MVQHFKHVTCQGFDVGEFVFGVQETPCIQPATMVMIIKDWKFNTEDNSPDSDVLAEPVMTLVPHFYCDEHAPIEVHEFVSSCSEDEFLLTANISRVRVRGDINDPEK
jgi:hypothetical protein